MKTLNAFAQFVVLLSLPLLLGGCGEETHYSPLLTEEEVKIIAEAIYYKKLRGVKQ